MPANSARIRADNDWFEHPYARDPRPPEKKKEVRPNVYEGSSYHNDFWYYWLPVYFAMIAWFFALMHLLSGH